MGFLLLIAGAVIVLICAWLVTSLTSLLSGDRSGSLRSAWWDIFSNMWSRESSYAEPLPDVLRPRKFCIGDKVRVLRVPSNADHSVSPERQKLLESCVGRVFRVAGVDALGAVELHVQDDGTQSSGRAHNIVFVSPDYVESVATEALSGG